MPMSFLPAASTHGGTIPNGITAACRMRPASRSAARDMLTRSPQLVCFLVSDDSGFITGQTIHVNGGVGFY